MEYLPQKHSKHKVYNHYVQLNISKTSDHMNKSKYL